MLMKLLKNFDVKEFREILGDSVWGSFIYNVRKKDETSDP